MGLAHGRLLKSKPLAGRLIGVARPTGVRSLGPGPVLHLCSAPAGRRTPKRGAAWRAAAGDITRSPRGRSVSSRHVRWDSAVLPVLPSSRTNRHGQRPVRPHTPKGVACHCVGGGHRCPRVGPARSLFSSQGTALPWPALTSQLPGAFVQLRAAQRRPSVPLPFLSLRHSQHREPA